MVFAISDALSFSLLAEGSYQEEQLMVNARKALKTALLYLLPIAVIVFTLGDKILLLFGETYSENATTLLWILPLSAAPLSVNLTYLTILRVRKNIRKLIIVSLAITLLSLGLGSSLMMYLGIIGVGVGWIAGQGLVAAAILLSLLLRGRLL